MVKFILNYYLINYIWCLNMINFFIKGAIKRAALKLATDKKFRSKTKNILKNTKELNEKGELMKSLGRSAGRLKSIIKKEL